MDSFLLISDRKPRSTFRSNALQLRSEVFKSVKVHILVCWIKVRVT
jgi:hypothetical protein